MNNISVPFHLFIYYNAKQPHNKFPMVMIRILANWKIIINMKETKTWHEREETGQLYYPRSNLLWIIEQQVIVVQVEIT